MADYEVIIVGAGPAGLGAAAALNHMGIKNILVVERDSEPGGIPRHVHHPTFGLLAFKRPMSGPKFIGKILYRGSGVAFATGHSVVAIRPNGQLEIATPEGGKTISARHIILATGAREQPRHPRLVSGLRPQGITTTGALQKFVYGTGLLPFRRPVIIGTELASFSALWTLKSAGAKAVAMIEANPRITTYRPAVIFAALMGTPIHKQAKIVDIGGKTSVEYVLIQNSDNKRTKILCDGIIFSGNFVGETALTKQSHLQFGKADQLPLADQNRVSSDPQISIIGNSAHPADSGDQCYLEGLEAGRHVAKLLKSKPRTGKVTSIEIFHPSSIKTITPGMVRLSAHAPARFDINLHVSAIFSGQIEVSHGDILLYSKRHRCHPARRISLRGIVIDKADQNKDAHIEITLNPRSRTHKPCNA